MQLRHFFALLGLLFLCSHATSLQVADPLVQQWLDEQTGKVVKAPITPSKDTYVTIKNGTIKGSTTVSFGNHTIYQYLGIPYAKPPVNELRFEAPLPFDGFGDTIYDALSHPKACPQYLTNLTEADEDCLYVSVYSRNEGNSSGLLPVIYYVHGGAFILGQNSMYNPAKLLSDEVVLVTVQYRLGIMGFLNLGDDSHSANNGMKDVVAGLRWVNENIEGFGGDPNRVTIHGLSAGSASVLYLLISPLAQGLFHQVVAQSGTPLQEWAIDREPLRSAQRIGGLLNCTTEPNSVLLECLKSQEWAHLFQANLGIILKDFTEYKVIFSGASPSIEGDKPGAFLTDDPLKLLETGPLPDVAVMLGAVQHEGTILAGGAHYLILEPEGKLNDSIYIRDHMVGDLLRTYGVKEDTNGGSISQALGVGYFRPGSRRDNFTELQYQLIDICSVVLMKAPILKTADILSRRLSTVYLYSFEHYNANNSLFHLLFLILEPIFGGTKPNFKPGIMHGDDLIYMFNLPFVLNPEDIDFSRMYVHLFTHFAMYGTPTPEGISLVPQWPKYDTQTQQYMRLALPFEVKSDYTSSWRQGMPA